MLNLRSHLYSNIGGKEAALLNPLYPFPVLCGTCDEDNGRLSSSLYFSGNVIAVSVPNTSGNLPVIFRHSILAVLLPPFILQQARLPFILFPMIENILLSIAHIL